MNLGDLLGGAIGILRFNPKASIGLTAIVMVVGFALSVPVALLATRASRFSYGDDVGALLGVSGVLGLPSLLTIMITTPMLSRVTYEAILGNKVTINQAWVRVRPRMWNYVAATLLAGVITFAVSAATVAVLNLALSGGGYASTLIMLFLFTLLGSAVALALTVKLNLYPAAIVLDAQNWWRAFGRSWQLTNGYFWANLGRIVVASIMVSVLAWVFQVPVNFLAGLVGIAWTNTSAQILVIFGAYAITQLLSLMIIMPFLVAFSTLLWTDMKIRKEGFDLTLMEQADRDTAATA